MRELNLLVKLVANKLDIGKKNEELGGKGQLVVHCWVDWTGHLERIVRLGASRCLILERRMPDL